jgi:excisionase family DNA binding protein
MAIKVAKQFCTTREAAQILGISLKTAQLWCESGLLEAWRTEGGHRRIMRRSVEALLATSDQPLSTPRGRLPKGSTQKNRFQILVAEDDLLLQRVYAASLGNWAIKPEVTIANNGFEALLQIGHAAPDLLITDLNMPGVDGFQMIKTLRSMPGLSDMEIIVVTGLDPSEIGDNSGLPGGIQIFPKPVPFPKLEQVANELARRKQSANTNPDD